MVYKRPVAPDPGGEPEADELGPEAEAAPAADAAAAAPAAAPGAALAPRRRLRRGAGGAAAVAAPPAAAEAAVGIAALRLRPAAHVEHADAADGIEETDAWAAAD
eukprot:16371102-Heterocapsa_arctica.AAC.1